MNTTHRKPKGMHIPPHAYTAQQKTMNAFACFVCGIEPITEAEWIAADIANSRNKTERHDAAALKDQIRTQDKVGAL